jgi:hypothetical protein
MKTSEIIKSKILCWIYKKFFNKYKIEPLGIVPVQAEGKLPTGEYYYFRSRGERWSLSVSDKEEDIFDKDKCWYYFEEPFTWPEGGYIDDWESIKYFNKAVKLYYKSKKQ